MRIFMSAALSALVVFAAPALASARPAQPATQTDLACRWEWRSGGGVGLWTETCALATGTWAVSYNEAETRFELTLDGNYMSTVIEVYKIPDGADMSTVLSELKARGHIPDAAECVFKPLEEEPTDKSGKRLFEIRPIGSRLKAFEAAPADEIPEPPCGDYGWSTHGRRTFRVDAQHAEMIVYVDEGQDGTMIAPETITFD